MKRCFINVAIGSPYIDYQKRLIKSVNEKMPDVDLLTWTNELPAGSKPHKDSMYGFKMYAFQEAFNRGYDLVIWLDTPTVLHESIDFVFNILEADKNGEFAITTDVELYRYCNQNTIDVFGFNRQYLKTEKWMLNYGFIFGFTKGSKTFDKMFECEKNGLFTSAEQDWQDHQHNSGKAFNGEYVEHRHEESIISIIIQSERRKLHPLSTVLNKLEWEKTSLQE